MRPAGADPFHQEIEIQRTKRRSVELRLEHGRLIARVPRRISRSELDEILPELRRQLWTTLARRRVFDEDALVRCAHDVAARHLGDLSLPPFRIRFSSRQNRRWGSCTRDPSAPESRIRISDRLRGHPVWVFEHLVLHELIHLVIPDHGPRFKRLMERCPHRERAEGYLEALEGLALLGEETPAGEQLLDRLSASVVTPETSKGEPLEAAVGDLEELPLFNDVDSSRDPEPRLRFD